MRSKLSIRRKISVFSIDYDIQSKPLANIDMITVIFHSIYFEKRNFIVQDSLHSY